MKSQMVVVSCYHNFDKNYRKTYKYGVCWVKIYHFKMWRLSSLWQICSHSGSLLRVSYEIFSKCWKNLPISFSRLKNGRQYCIQTSAPLINAAIRAPGPNPFPVSLFPQRRALGTCYGVFSHLFQRQNRISQAEIMKAKAKKTIKAKAVRSRPRPWWPWVL